MQRKYKSVMVSKRFASTVTRSPIVLSFLIVLIELFYVYVVGRASSA